LPTVLAAPLTLSLLMMGAWLASAPPLRALGTGVAPLARLRLPSAYLALAPYCDVMDTLSLMSVRQHVALLATVLVAYTAWRWRRRDPKRRPPRAVLVESARGTALLGAIVAVYALGALAPRPMAALELLAADELAIDFHSHTQASWDGRRTFTAERNRAWHREAGFDATYISDHGTIAGVIAGQAGNPARAGDGTVILPATEVRCIGQHVVVLGATTQDTTADCAQRSPMATHRVSGTWRDDARIALLTIPGQLENAQALPVVQAIEIADGAPRAFDQMERDEQLLQRIADDAGLARVSGSNIHGWGRTATAWSVMSIDNWRAMSPHALDIAIRRRLYDAHGDAVHVIERRRPDPAASSLALAATVPVVVWSMLTSLSGAERLAWLCWIWTAGAIVALVRRRRAYAKPRVVPIRVLSSAR
jgi:predicted metal-dependent phosphoesterase TrpH